MIVAVWFACDNRFTYAIHEHHEISDDQEGFEKHVDWETKHSTSLDSLKNEWISCHLLLRDIHEVHNTKMEGL
jgi:hypothetical protein